MHIARSSPYNKDQPKKILISEDFQENFAVKQPELKMDILSAEKERIKKLPQLTSNISVRTFGLILGDPFIKGTLYEGQTLEEQLNYWNSCLQRWVNPSDSALFIPDIEKKSLSEIFYNFNLFAQLNEKFQNEDPDTIRQSICQALTEKNYCIIPLKTKAASAGNGHVFSCVLEQDEKGSVTATILNAGAGSELHPLVQIENHSKRSFMFPQIEFNDKYFFKDNPELACHVLKLICDYARLEPNKDHDPKEIYQIFLLLGKIKTDDTSDYTAIQSQRSGSCPAKAMKLGLRHYFLKHTDLKNYKKSIFYIKLQSLYDMYVFLQKSSSTISNKDIFLIKRSISQFSYSLEKAKLIIDDKTLLTAQSVLKLIDEKLPKKVVTSEDVSTFLELEETTFQIPQKIKKEKKISKSEIAKFVIETEKFKTPEPQLLKGYLQKINEKFKRISSTDYNGLNCLQALKTLPIPSSGKSDLYWDAIPADDRLEIIKQLNLLVEKANKYAEILNLKRIIAPMFLMRAAVFTMVDFLARKNPNMQLYDLSYNFNFKKLHKHNYFQMGVDIARINQINDYFSKIKTKHVIFDFKPKNESILTLDQNENCFTNHSYDEANLGGHLRYLDRMLKTEDPKKSWVYSALIDDYQFDSDHLKFKEKFQEIRSRIPEEYYYLQKACFEVQYSLENNALIRYFSKNKPFLIKGHFDNNITIDFNSYVRTEIEPSLKTPFDEIYSSNKSTQTENALIFKLSRSRNNDISANIHSGLCKIMKNSETRATMAMKFAEDYFEILNSEEVQFLIQYAFLNSKSIMKQLIQEPSYKTTLHNFLDNMLSNSELHASKSELIFWIKLSVCIETQISTVYDEDIPFNRLAALLEKCENIIKFLDRENKLIENDFHDQIQILHMIKIIAISFSKKELEVPRDSELIETLINSYIFYKLNGESKEIHFTQITEECFVKHLDTIRNYFDAFPNKIFKNFLQQIEMNTLSPDATFQTMWPIYTCQSGKDLFEIYFPNIYINGDNWKYGSWPVGIKRDPLVKEIFNDKFPPVNVLSTIRTYNETRYTDYRVIAKDGSFEIKVNKGKIVIEKYFNFHNENHLLTYLDLKIEIPCLNQFSNNKLWKDISTGIIWLLDGKQQPFAQIKSESSESNNFKITKVDKYWNPLSNGSLVNTSGKNRVATSFEKFCRPEEIITWGTEKGEIKEINFPTHNLTFYIKEIGKHLKAIYEANSEYSLTSSEEILNPLNTALYMENINNPNKKSMILAFNTIKTNDFCTSPQNANFIEKTHFFYELDSKNGLWHSSSQLAMLYLIYAYQRHGMYDLAAEHLNYFKPSTSFNKSEIDILSAMMVNNLETRSICIALKSILIFLNAKKLSSFEAKEARRICPRFFKLSSENVDRLIQLMGFNFASNRLHYSPNSIEIQQILSYLNITIITELSSNVFFLSLYINSDEVPENFPYNNTLFSLIKSYFYNQKIQLKLNPSDMNSFLKEIKLFSESSLPAKDFNFITKKPYNESEMFARYFTIILNKNSSELEKTFLEIEFTIQFEQVKPKDPILLLLYFAMKFPEKFRACIDQYGFTPDAIISFLNYQKVKDLAEEISSIEHIDAYSIDRKNISIQQEDSIECNFKFSFNISNWENLKKIFRRPLILIAQKFITSKKTKINHDQEFILSSISSNHALNDGTLTKLNEFKNAFTDKVPKNFIEYQLNSSKTPEQLLEALNGKNGIINHSKQSIEKLKEKIHEMLNFPNNEELSTCSIEYQQAVLNHRNHILQEKIQLPSLQNHLLPSFLLQDPSILKKVNPFLTDKEINILYDNVINYMLEFSRIDQASEALDLVKQAISKPKNAPNLFHQVGVVLAKERHYNPYKYPEMLIYEYATGNMLRNQPDQAKLLKKIIKTIFAENINQPNAKIARLFFEFQAGEGKTKVLSVILAARAQREGKIPIFFSLPSLFDIVKEDIRLTLQRVYQLGSIPLSIPLGKKLGETEIEALDDLVKRKGISITTTPETWHSLKLQWQDALINSSEANKSIAQIFKYLKEKGVFFIDESHRNISSMIEANFATGIPTPYPKYAIDVITSIYDVLYGWIDKPLTLSNDRYLHEELGLMENSQVSLSPKIQEEILRTLGKYMLVFLQIPQARREEFFRYLMDDKAPIPKLYEKLKSEDSKETISDEFIPEFIDKYFWKKIDLTKGMIGCILPHAFSLKGMMDYGPSENLAEDVCVPYILGKPAGPNYEDKDFESGITIQNIRQQSLYKYQIARYLEYKLYQLNMVKAKGIAEFEIYLNDLKKLYSSTKYPWESLTFKSLINSALIQEYAQALSENRSVIQEYEKVIALRHVNHHPFKYCSTNPELSVSASGVIHTSATLGVLEENPYLDTTELFMTMPEFIADVIQRAMLPHNQETHWVEESTPFELLENLYFHKADFQRIDGIINIGGICKGSSSKTWAKDVLKFNKKYNLGYAGVIIAKDERIENKVENRLYIVRPDVPDVLIEGSDVKLAIMKLGLSDLRDQRFFKCYSSDMTTGTDLSLSSDAKMIFAIGENTTIYALIQGIMRMRGFLQNPIDPKTSQSLIWIGIKKIENMLKERYGKASPAEAFLNAISCQVILETNAIKLRAIQDIEMIIREIAVINLENGFNVSKQKNALQIEMNNDPSKKYGVQVTTQETQQYLMHYANNFASKAGIELEEHIEAKNRIAAAILQVSQKMKTIDSPVKANLLATLFQHQNTQQDQTLYNHQRKHTHNTSIDFKSAAKEEDYAKNSLQIGSITSLIPNESFLANHVLNVKWLLPNLYLLPNFYRTIEQGGQLKPSSFILATQNCKTNERDYRVISTMDAIVYSKQLKNRERSDNQQTAILFTSNGAIHQTDLSEARLSIIECEKWRQSEEFRLILAQVGLIDGRSIERSRQWEFVKKTPGIMADLERIQSNQLLNQDITNQRNWENLMEMLNRPVPPISS